MNEFEDILPYAQASEVLFALSLLLAWLTGLVVIFVSGWREWRASRRRRAVFGR